ncbi:MAG: FadR/GntR family transcriptional regulator [Pirellulales bacterium]
MIVTILQDCHVNKLLEQTRVVDGLADFIRNEGYADGDRLPPIRELADKFKAGRNAVRDALLEVQTLGLVRIEPRQGVFVQTADSKGRADRAGRALERSLSRDEQNLFHLVDARLAVETAVAAEAARSRRPEDLLPLRQALEAVLTVGDDRAAYVDADERFHLMISRIAGNHVLSTFLEILWRFIRPAKSNLFLSSQNRRVSDREHQEIFRAIVSGDVVSARETMDEHIRQGRALLMDYARTIPTTTGAQKKRRRR